MILPIKESLIKYVFEPNAQKVGGRQGTGGGAGSPGVQQAEAKREERLQRKGERR